MPETKTETPDISKWFGRIKASKALSDADFKPRYDLARKRLRSELDVKSQKKGRPVHNQVGLVYAIGNGFVNSVAFKMPEINLRARNDEERELVENTEIKINDFFRDKKVKRTAKRGIWDAYLGGLHARFVDWNYKDVETEEPITVPVGVDELGNQISEPVLKEDGTPEFKRQIIKNEPVYKRIRPDLVRFPDGFDLDNFQESPWIGFDVILPLEDVKEEQGFDKNVTESIKGKTYDSENESRGKKTGTKDDTLYTRVHYVFENGGDTGPLKLYVLSEEDQKQPLKVEDFEKGQDGYPIKFLYFNPLDDDTPFPCGDPWLWESQLRAIDDYWARLHKQVSKSNPKIGYDKRDVPQDTVTAMKSNEGQEYVGVEPKQGRIASNVFFPITYPPAHPDNERFLEYAESILNRMAPRTSVTQGDGQQTDTATEASIIQQGEMVDLEARADDIKEYFVDLARDLAGLYTNNLVGEIEVRGKTSTGIDVNRKVGRDGFTTNIEVDIDVESMKAPNREVYRAQLLRMVETLRALDDMLKQKGKTIDPEFFLPKIIDTFGVRNAENAVTDLNLRNPNRQHEDAAFKGIPFDIDHDQDLQGDLAEHMELLSDPERLSAYESIQPGFAASLQEHTNQVQQLLSKQQVQGSKPIPSGKRPEQATEAQRV